jgi:hypothetical protein
MKNLYLSLRSFIFLLTLVGTVINNNSFSQSITDSIQSFIPKKEQRQVFKFVNKIAKVQTTTLRQETWENVYNYYFKPGYFDGNTLQSVRSIQFFLNQLDSRIKTMDGVLAERQNFIDSANQLLNTHIVHAFRTTGDVRPMLSLKWKEMRALDAYPWVQIDFNQTEFKDQIKLYIIRPYFKQLRDNSSLSGQQNIVKEFTTLFPSLTPVGISPIDYIINTHGADAHGTLTLFNHSYFKFYLSNVAKYDWYLIRNHQDINISFSTTDNYKEVIKLEGSLQFESVEGFINEKKYFELQIADNQNRRNLDAITFYKDGQKIKETHFYFPVSQPDQYKSYSFEFSNGENLTKKGIEDTLRQAINLALNQETDSALTLLSYLDAYDFPDTLSLYRSIQSTKLKIIDFQQIDQMNLLEKLLLEAEFLIEDKEFKRAQQKLNEALLNCPIGSPNYNRITKLEGLIRE